ncbi:MAG: sigma 54-interacting transcriptional regulator [Candidatus Binatus sp.]
MILARGAGSATEGESADQREREPLRDCVGEFRLRAPVGDGDRLGDSGPFVTFNCSNLVDSLAESQLFGHVRGGFTDAREDSLGYFRSAKVGTLFL